MLNLRDYMTDAEKARADAQDAEYRARVLRNDEDNLVTLKMILQHGEFHHATYRDVGKLWEGWYIYCKAPPGEAARLGFKLEFSFGKNSHLSKEVEELIRNTGYSVGSYGEG